MTDNLPATTRPLPLRTLAEIEAAIDGAVHTINEALLEILDRRLYKDTHASFDLYCEQKWQITGRTARRRVDALRATLALGTGAAPVSQREAAAKDETPPADRKSRTRASENDRSPSPPTTLPTTAGEQITPSDDAMPPLEYQAKKSEGVPTHPPAAVVPAPSGARIPTDAELEDALFALLDAIDDPQAFYARLSDARKAHLRSWVRSLNPPAEAARKPERGGARQPAAHVARPAPAPLDRREVVTLFKKA